jgi:hypothetical protein
MTTCATWRAEHQSTCIASAIKLAWRLDRA